MIADLAFFFNPLPEALSAEAESYSDLYYAAEIYTLLFPRLQPNAVVLFGLPDNLQSAEGTWELADAFRRQFYRLKRTAQNVQLYDLGNLRPAETPDQTLERIGVVSAKLIEAGAVPVVIAPQREGMLGLFRAAFDQEEHLTNLVNIDAGMDLDQDQGVLHRLVTLRHHLPSHFCQIGYQSYLVDPMGLTVLERLNFEALRLGQIHENFRLAEPYLRDADFLHFNLSALRNTAYLHAPGPRPFGLNGEQACQLCWYAGISTRLKAVGFFNMLTSGQSYDADMATLAIMVWHFIEGFSYRTEEQPFNDNLADRHTVALSGYEDLVFMRSRRTDRWWMVVPDGTGQYPEGYPLPCLYEDYIHAANGHLPDRWIRTFGRLN